MVEFLKNGGLTATGGEPLAQLDFLIELFKKAKEKNIHTCIDTSGIAYNPEDGKVYLTGKNWPRLYEVRLVEL